MNSVLAQESADSGGGDAGGGASSSFGSPFGSGGTSAGGTNPVTGESTGGSGSPAFRFGGSTPADSGNGGTTPDTGPRPGASSSFGDSAGGGGGRPLQAAETNFSVPGQYGAGRQNFTVGEGRLARPRYRFSGTVSLGYDSNVFQTPTDAVGIPELGIPAPDRVSSLLTRAELGWDVQFASRRTLFTFDIGGSADYYWNRPGKKVDFTGRLALIYLRRLTPRLQFSVNVGASYQQQPDFALANTPTRNRGDYLVGNAKADLSYRLTPRFSAVASVSFSTFLYQDEIERNSNYSTTTFGTELRYLYSPRVTAVAELRYGISTFPNSSTRDNNTVYLLVGGDVTLSRRFLATVRVGETLQTFTDGGDRSSSPYVEANLDYRLARGTIVRWTNRYGFEQPGSADTSVTAYRTGLSVTQIFTPRFQGTLGVNFAYTSSTFNSSDSSFDQTSIQPSIGFQYTLDRYWSLSLNYIYSTVVSTGGAGDYDQSRVFLGAQYRF